MPYVEMHKEYRVEDRDGNVVAEGRDMQKAADTAHAIGGVVYEDTYELILVQGDVVMADYRQPPKR